MNLYELAIAKKLAGGGGGGGGGASNIISGEFTAQATEGTQTITIPYEGTGYPIMIRVVAESIPTLVDENIGSMVAFVGLAKYMGQVPTYNQGYYDKMVVASTYIASDLTLDTPNGANVIIYGGNTAGRTAPNATVKITSATQIAINVEASGAGGWVGFRANKKYYYEIVYSE